MYIFKNPKGREVELTEKLGSIYYGRQGWEFLRRSDGGTTPPPRPKIIDGMIKDEEIIAGGVLGNQDNYVNKEKYLSGRKIL